MGLTYVSDVSTDVAVTNAAETVVATLTGVSSQRAGQRVELEGTVNITTGTSTTAVVLRIREDTLTGTLVGEIATDTLSTAVGSPEDHTIHAEHTPTGEIANKSYVLTVVQTAGAGAGTANHASLRADTTP
jgi:hypothetical protein